MFILLMFCIRSSICPKTVLPVLTESSVYLRSGGTLLLYITGSELKAHHELSDWSMWAILSILASCFLILFSRKRMYFLSHLLCRLSTFVRKLRGSSTVSCIFEMSVFDLTSNIDLNWCLQEMQFRSPCRLLLSAKKQVRGSLLWSFRQSRHKRQPQSVTYFAFLTICVIWELTETHWTSIIHHFIWLLDIPFLKLALRWPRRVKCCVNVTMTWRNWDGTALFFVLCVPGLLSRFVHIII